MMKKMRQPVRLLMITLLLACVSTPAASGGTIQDIFNALSPGEKFHLAFVTRDDYGQSTSTDIEDYNNFVQQQAMLAGSVTAPLTASLSLTWKAIASTATVDARDNAIVGAFNKVFMVDFMADGALATGAADFWDGVLARNLDIDQFDNMRPSNATRDMWTGSKFDGTADVGFTLGSANVRTGTILRRGALLKGQWIQDATHSELQTDQGLYALSEAIEVPGTAVPEPTSAAVWVCLALVGMTVSIKQRQRQRATVLA